MSNNIIIKGIPDRIVDKLMDVVPVGYREVNPGMCGHWDFMIRLVDSAIPTCLEMDSHYVNIKGGALKYNVSIASEDFVEIIIS